MGEAVPYLPLWKNRHWRSWYPPLLALISFPVRLKTASDGCDVTNQHPPSSRPPRPRRCEWRQQWRQRVTRKKNERWLCIVDGGGSRLKYCCGLLTLAWPVDPMITDQTHCYLLTSQWSVPGAQEPRDRGDRSPQPVTVPRRGHSSQRSITGGQHIFCPPNQSRAPWTHLVSYRWGRFSIRFQGLMGWIGAPAVSIRVLHNKPGPCGMDQGPQDESGPCRTNPDPMWRTRALQDEAGAPTRHYFLVSECVPPPRK